MQQKVYVLLSTYNGEKYLKEQLDSLINQSYKNYKIIIRDDGSVDKTVEILKEYAEKNSKKIILMNSKENIGVLKSFVELLKFSHASYIMFCDQDDIWLKNKIEVSLKEIKKQEKIFDGPLLIHTDQKLIRSNGEIFSQSSKRYFKYNYCETSFKYLICFPNVVGCTMIINEKLINIIKKKLLHINLNQIILHDHMISLICSIKGKIVYLDIPTMLYRVHNENITVKLKKDFILKRIFDKKRKEENYKNINQALEILKNYDEFIYEKKYQKYEQLNKKKMFLRFFYLFKILKSKSIMKKLKRIVYF